MTGKHDKHDTTEPSRRPLAQKLSGFITRHGSKKSKKSPWLTDEGHESTSIFNFKRQKKAASPETTLEYKPLEVDLNKLEDLSLSAGWLENDTRNADHGREQQASSAPDNTTTPIASLFESKSVLNLPSSGQHSRSGSQNHAGGGTRPYSMIETPSVAYTRTSVDLTSTRNAQATGSVLDRGRPVEARSFVTDPLRRPKSLRQEPQDGITASEIVATSEVLPRKSHLSPTPSVSSQHHTRGQGSMDRGNRHSMYAVVTPPSDSVNAASRSASAMPLGRIQAWQKSVTSAPSSGPPPATRSVSGSAAAPSIPPQGAPSVRRVSTRGGVGNRLAWIRELEEKKSSASQDLGVLKKQSGSVSDKLAMFENKQGRTASPALTSRLPPLTRTNSTTSRLSSVGLESASSANGNATATPRTSIDTTRSSHRASSVMSNYDDSFRERMESIVGDYPDKDKSEAPKELRRVTAQFVAVGSEKASKEAKPKPDVNPEKDDKELPSPRQEVGATEAGKEEKEDKELQSPQAEVEASDANPEKAQEAEKELPSVQPETAPESPAEHKVENGDISHEEVSA